MSLGSSLYGLFLLVGFTLSVFPTYGQNLITKTRVFTQKDGLADFTINDVEYDEAGFLWLSTTYGLHRYDGQSFEWYSPENSNLFGHRVGQLYKDTKGNIWINYWSKLSTNQGFLNIDVLNPHTKAVTRLKDYLEVELPFEYHEVTCFNQNEDGSFWYGTSRGNIYEYNATGFEVVFEQAPLSYEGNIEKTASGNGWVQYGADNNQALYFNTHSVLLDSFVLGVDSLTTAQHILQNWLGQEDNALFIKLFNPSKNYYYLARKAPFKALQPFRLGNLTDLSGILLKNRKQILAVDNPKRDSFFLLDLQGNCVYRAKRPHSFPIAYRNTVDEQGNIWQSQPNKSQISMTYLRDSKFKRYVHDRIAGGSIATSARGAWQAPDGRLYFAGWYFWMQKDEAITYLYKLAHLKEDELLTSLSLLKDKNHPLLWFGDENASLHTLNIETQQLQTYHYHDSISLEKLAHWSLYQDHRGKIWIGHQKGLSFFNSETNTIEFYKQYQGFESLKQASVFHFHENEQGIWLATDQGIFLWSTEKGVLDRFHVEGDSTHYLPHNNIAHIHEDQEGYFWLASKGGGLIQWKPYSEQFKQFTTQQGLSHNIIYAVYEDAYDHLWLSSNYGIISINKNNFSVKNFHLEDGLSDEEFNTVSHYQAPDGHIFFGGLNGFTSFHPKDFQEALPQYPLRLTALKKQNGETGLFESKLVDLVQDSSNTIYVYPSDKSIIFEFRLLDFRAPETYQYAYKIEGLDQDWNYLSTGEIRLNNLPYGSYTLKIKAQGLGGQWNEQQLEYQIIVPPPFYKKGWFLLLVVGLLLFLAWSFYHWRIIKLQQEQQHLEQVVQERTQQIEQDRQVIQQQAEELKELDKLKSRFFANISHELKTPLTLILSPLSYTLDNFDQFEVEEIKQFLNTSVKNGHNLLDLVEEILDLAKLEANQLFLLETPTPIHELLRAIFLTFVPKLEEQQLSYDLVLPLQQDSLYLSLDRKKVEKIVNNFLSNAVKHTPPNGHITVELTEEDKTMLLQVMDTGRGIAPEDLPYIFDRFYQSKAPDALKQGGTGIGLSLVKEFAQLMQGAVGVESVLGEGSTFFFRFPKKEVTVQKVVATLEEEELSSEGVTGVALQGDYTLLIVEDNTDMRHYIQALLEKQFTVLTGNNGVEGLALLEEHESKIDLIISDVMMPQMDGLTMFRTIKATAKWRHIPTITLTALSSKKDKLDALSIGIDDYLTKPFFANELLLRVKNLLYNYQQRILLYQQTGTSSSAPLTVEEIKTNKELLISDQDAQWLKEVELYTQENISNNQFKALQLSIQMNMTEKTFRRHLTRLTGLTPNKYITELRLQAARALVEQRKYNSIQRVCYEVGFKTPKYFSKLYKERFGVSPSAYI